MKKMMLLAVGAALLQGCADPTEKGADAVRLSDEAFAVEEARCVFEAKVAARARSRAADGEQQPGFFMPGEILPLWDEAREVPAEEFARVDVPVETTYDFFRLVPCEETGELNPVAIPRTLVVLKDPSSERRSVYFCFYIADDDFAEWYAARPRQEWIDGDAKNYFSGVILYTTLSGHIAAVGRYDHGRMEDGIFLGDSTVDKITAVTMICNMLQLTYLVRGVANPSTRTDIAWELDVETVQCIAFLPKKKELFIDWIIEIKPTELPPIRRRGGGGGGSSGSRSGGLNIRSLWSNSRILYEDNRVEDLLDDLATDCFGANLINSIDADVQIWKTFDGDCRTQMYSINVSDGDILYPLIQYFRIEVGYNLRDVSLFEELIHVYQYSGEPNMQKDRMNREVEAKLGWFMYRERIQKVDDLANALGGDEGVDIFREISNCYRKKDFESARFYESYDAAVSILRRIEGYRDEAAYPMNPAARSFKNLETLMTDC